MFFEVGIHEYVSVNFAEINPKSTEIWGAVQPESTQEHINVINSLTIHRLRISFSTVASTSSFPNLCKRTKRLHFSPFL